MALTNSCCRVPLENCCPIAGRTDAAKGYVRAYWQPAMSGGINRGAGQWRTALQLEVQGLSREGGKFVGRGRLPCCGSIYIVSRLRLEIGNSKIHEGGRCGFRVTVVLSSLSRITIMMSRGAVRSLYPPWQLFLAEHSAHLSITA